ncbi:MAG TPA: hypothetical protein VHZ95_02330, partial [Polyangiales bacterium]|nr:hypothetical protein [Polyangiales bacterium]
WSRPIFFSFVALFFAAFAVPPRIFHVREANAARRKVAPEWRGVPPVMAHYRAIASDLLDVFASKM